MLGLAVAIQQLIRAFRQSFADPGFRALIFVFGLLMTTGTVFYHRVEEWSWLDSAYFSVVTMATVGYGDFAPQTSLGKVFTMFYMLLGTGIFIVIASTVGNTLVQLRRSTIARGEDQSTDAHTGQAGDKE